MTFYKFSLIKLKPLSCVISFRMQEICVLSDIENLKLAPTTVPSIAQVRVVAKAPYAHLFLSLSLQFPKMRFFYFRSIHGR